MNGRDFCLFVQNATTLWENWQGSFPQGTSSDNHIMFGGGVGTAVYRHIAGLAMCPGATAWSCLDIRPAPDTIARLRSARAWVHSHSSFTLHPASFTPHPSPSTSPFTLTLHPSPLHPPPFISPSTLHPYPSHPPPRSPLHPH